MSTILTNRVQSAYSRSNYRSEINGNKNKSNNNIKQRPKTSKNPNGSYGNVLNDAALKVLEPSTIQRGRPETGSVCTTTTTTSSSVSRATTRKLRSDEVEDLLDSLERNDEFLIKVNCLADYRTLVQTIDLRATPLDCQYLCALQQRENRIIQQNACRDLRFLSLMDSLQPFRVLEAKEDKNSNTINRRLVPEYLTHNL